MMRIRLAFLAIFLAAPALADPVADQLDKARAEVNTVENAANRSIYHADRGNTARAREEAKAASLAARRALYAVDRAREIYRPAPAPVPTPTPTPTPDPHEGHTAPPTQDVGLRTPISAPIANVIAPTQSIPSPGHPSDQGAFRILCMTSHFNADDALVFPGQPGKAHLHRYMGNTLTDADSTYETLRTSGGSSCHGLEAYRSAIWTPALFDQDGRIVVPDYDVIYYKRWPKTDARCKSVGRECVDLPVGLAAIFGSNYAKDGAPSPGVRFDCSGRNISTTIAEAMRDCKPGEQFFARIETPMCWDGVRSAAADHQSHLAYSFYEPQTGQLKCPASHPFVTVQITITTGVTILPGDRPAEWEYSSDRQMGRPGGTTYHGDYKAAFDPEVERTWHANCIEKRLSCSDGELGDGTILRRPDGFSFDPKPRVRP